MKLSAEAADTHPLPRDHDVLLMQPMDRAEGDLTVDVSFTSDVTQDVENVDEGFDHHRHSTSLQLTYCDMNRSSSLFITDSFLRPEGVLWVGQPRIERAGGVTERGNKKGL
jgi:hypothetical protein